jgi:pimeloyl-ACP methyl ester carboxylesterase
MFLENFDKSRQSTTRINVSGKPQTLDDVSIHVLQSFPPDDAPSKGTILLIHGFPETSHQFRHVMGPLSDAGYHVVAPDYRGAGYSSRPRFGYDKVTMAADLHALLTEHLGVTKKVHVVGHDIGGMIASTYAQRHGDGTASVAWGECPLPGTEVYKQMIKDEAYGSLWHFIFHWQADLPEKLVDTEEKVKAYISSFYYRLTHQPAAFSAEDVDYYTKIFSQTGAMRAGFDVYRAFHQDSLDNRSWVEKNGKSKVPCMMLNGGESFLAAVAEDEGNEMFENVVTETVKGSGHWIAEENPKEFVKTILEWVGKHA